MLRKSLFWIVGLLLLAGASIIAGRAKEKPCADYLYGLYYGDWGDQDNDTVPSLAFVVSSDGKPIPPKANDLDAPTLPGFYAKEKRYDFAWSKVSTKEISFRTKEIDGTAFSFQGRFGCESVHVIPEVPYFAGELKEMRNGRLIRKKNLHFGHAVVL